MSFMPAFRITFDQPAYLLLLGLLPVIWWLGRHSLAALGPVRRWLALGLRWLVLTLIVLALADIQYERRSEQLTVVYLLDQSLSIPAPLKQAMLQYVGKLVETHRDSRREDRFAVIVFGRDAEVEIPLVSTNLALRNRVESVLDPEYTDLATALQRAKALFPYDSAKRIVLITDGNQNLGDAYREAQSASGAGVSIDVTPVYLSARNEVSVEKVDLPAGVRSGQPFELRVVLNNESPDNTDATGTLRIVRKAGNQEDLVTEQQVELPPGKRVFSIPVTIDQADFYTYEARFSALDPQSDSMPQNNLASAFTHVRGKGQVLLIENYDRPGEFDFLVDRLRREEIEVVVTSTHQLFGSLAELQRYDAVILANVPRSSGADGDNIASFSDAQVSMLTRNTREMGCGLVMLGGPDSFGAGGWSNTELEEAMPVDFQIKSAKVVKVGALVLMMHAGEMPQANYWQKRIAIESIKLLGNRDYCGLVQWNGVDQWLWGQSRGGLIRVGPNRKMMMARVDQMSIGDMPAFDGAMKMAAKAFAGVTDAAVKHMIIISDGDPTPSTDQTLKQLTQLKVKVSTVAVGSHGTLGSAEMRRIARVTGGKYYEVKSANALPKIYQREARRIARPLVYEPAVPVRPITLGDHEILRGLEGGQLPPVSGFVLTSVKENPLVEVLVRSPDPATEKNATLLAVWPYGAGKSVVLTTDAGKRWATDWTQWDGYDKFFSQAVRWAMRPSGDTGNYTVATNVRDGKTQVVVTALDAQEQFLNNQSMTAAAVAPDMSHVPIAIEQVAPGRYVGEFPSEEAGSYLIVVNPGSGAAPIRTGINVGYSAEYRDRETNLALLKSIAQLPAGEGPRGEIRSDGLLAEVAVEEPQYNPFRRDLPPAVATQSIWPWLLVVGSCLFWGDVFVRRVQLNFQWLTPVLTRLGDRLLRRQTAVPVPETMSRLRSRKEAVGAEIDSRKAAARFPVEGPATTGGQPPSPADQISGGTTQGDRTQPPATPRAPAGSGDAEKEAAPPEGGSYTERLLQAKKKVWTDRDPNKPPPEKPSK
jgi:uncharacterized membrane protein/Mg-chelatase subunit ChlD